MSHQPSAVSLFLALDTATDRPSFALGSPDDHKPDTAALEHRHDLSREIAAVVEGLLARRSLTAADLTTVIVADGPGSFTGLRIGIAFAKGLCRARGTPLVAIPSLLGAAHAASDGKGLVVAEYDALRGDVYRAVYRLGPTGVVTVTAPQVVPAGQPSPPDALRAGERHASAAALIELAGVPGAGTNIADPASWEPNYGRLAEAEARRKAQHAAR